MKPIVAIVGRPNVGKSMLFNKLIGKRLSIVEDTPGVTRDRIYGETDWNGRSFTLIDTGGIEPRTDDQILSFMRDQAQIAIENATVIIFLTDVRTGLTASDQEVANMLLRSGKPVYVDKTFAPDYATAARIFAVAEQSGTPCWSSSALRFAEEYQAADKTNIKGVNAWGPNGFEDYAIHQLEPIFMMMQAPATEVMHLTNDEVYTGVLRFADGRTATLSGYAKGSPFMMNIARSTENSVLEICSDYFRHFIEALVEFFKNGTIPAPHSETLSIISAWGALMEAEKTPGIWVKVPKD